MSLYEASKIFFKLPPNDHLRLIISHFRTESALIGQHFLPAVILLGIFEWATYDGNLTFDFCQ